MSTDAFKSILNKAAEAAEMESSNNGVKAVAYALMALAVAVKNRNNSCVENISEEAEKVEEVVAEEVKTVKVEKKEKPTKKESKKIEALEPQPQDFPVEAEEVKSETPSFTNEWTDEAVNYFADKFEYLSNFSEDVLNADMQEYSSGIFESVNEGLSPLNIEGFVALVMSKHGEKAA